VRMVDVHPLLRSYASASCVSREDQSGDTSQPSQRASAPAVEKRKTTTTSRTERRVKEESHRRPADLRVFYVGVSTAPRRPESEPEVQPTHCASTTGVASAGPGMGVLCCDDGVEGQKDGVGESKEDGIDDWWERETDADTTHSTRGAVEPRRKKNAWPRANYPALTKCCGGCCCIRPVTAVRCSYM
jgi:hypothetical protein